MRALSQDLLLYGYWKKQEVTITINPVPSDATVTLTAAGYTQSGNSITVPIGTPLTIEVSKMPDYNTWGPITKTVTGPAVRTIELSSAPTGVLEVTPMPSDAVVTLSAPGCAQIGNSITVPLGTSVHCTVTPQNGANLFEASADIEVVESEQEETVYCNASIVVTPTPADALTTISYNGNTYPGSEPLLVPYGAIVTYTAQKEGYDSPPAPIQATITQSQSLPITLQKTMITVAVVPHITSNGTNIYSPNALVELSCNDPEVEPVSGLGTQQIVVPVGSSVTYTVSQQYYDTETSVIENVSTALNQSVYMHPATLGVLLFDDEATWTMPTTDNVKMAIITNGGNGGNISSIKQVGGSGGGASGNAYIVDVSDWVAGDLIGISFAGNYVTITKNGSDYDSYPHGGNGVSSATNDLTLAGTDGGSAVAGNGGGGGSGGCRYFVTSIPHTTCAGASCHTTYSYVTSRGTIANGGDGGTQGNSGADGTGSTEIGTTPSAGGVGGTGLNSATGGAQNGGVHSDPTTATTSTPGAKGLKGTGASASQATILSLIQQNSLTSAALRGMIQGGGGGTGGVYGNNTSAYDSSKRFATPGTGGGGGAWTDGADGSDGQSNILVGDFVAKTGGQGGHGCVIIWRPSDTSFDWGQGQLGE